MTRDRTAGVLLLVAILVIVLVAPEGNASLAKHGTEPAAETVISIPPGAFSAEHAEVDFVNDGVWLALAAGSGPGAFVADVPFPPGLVTVHRVTLYAIDGGAESACVSLHRTSIAGGGDDEMGSVCSQGADPEVRPFNDSEITPRRILDRQGAVLRLTLSGPEALTFYGVRIVYS